VGLSTVRALPPLVCSGLGIVSGTDVPTASNIYTTVLMLKAELPTMLSLDVEYAFSVSGKQFQGNAIRLVSRQRF
jgi:hypothetical protein